MKKVSQDKIRYDDVVMEKFFADLWKSYEATLDKMFECAGFDYLQKMGYHIWDDVDYDAENVEAQYDNLLQEYHKQWNELTADAKAGKLMDCASLKPEALLTLVVKKDYEYFQ